MFESQVPDAASLFLVAFSQYKHFLSPGSDDD